MYDLFSQSPPGNEPSRNYDAGDAAPTCFCATGIVQSPAGEASRGRMRRFGSPSFKWSCNFAAAEAVKRDSPSLKEVLLKDYGRPALNKQRLGYDARW